MASWMPGLASEERGTRKRTRSRMRGNLRGTLETRGEVVEERVGTLGEPWEASGKRREREGVVQRSRAGSTLCGFKTS
jgi:hypothetical protein